MLDYFLGSGTTAIAAARTGRRWIGVEMSKSTVSDFILPRLAQEDASFESVDSYKLR